MFFGRHRKVRNLSTEKVPFLSVLGRLRDIGLTLGVECVKENLYHCLVKQLDLKKWEGKNL